MSRSERLLQLLDLLRRYHYPVSGETIAAETSVSLRTVYRDIASLRAQGAQIEGEAGVGFVLKPGFLLPPVMFSEEEIEALVLGSRWVARRTDKRLAAAAQNALAKVGAVVPAALQARIMHSSLVVGPAAATQGKVDMAVIRRAIADRQKVMMQYRDGDRARTGRVIWPFGLAFFEGTQIVLARCEMRQDFRHFRQDRILQFTPLEECYPKRREELFNEWRRQFPHYAVL